MRSRRGELFVIALALGACSKANESPSSGDTPGATRTRTSGAASESAAPTGSVTPSDAPETWSGHYAASRGVISIPDAAEWAGVKFRGDDAGLGLGDGDISLSVSSGGRVQGAVAGPLGPLRLTGSLAENAFTAALVSNEPGRGFAGTAAGVRSGDQISGTMRLSLPTANVVRAAEFTLERRH